MATEPFRMTATELLGAYASRALSPVEAMKSVLARTAERNPDINALIFIDEDAALAEARESEARWAKGAPKGALDGIPITIKDSIAEATRPMLRGIKANMGAKPSGYDAPPTARLKEANGIVFAKTTMPDFGLLASGVSSAFGITRNPWNLDFNPGGSSSGAAAGLAAQCGPLAVGSDIGGSVRIPAALCGLVALKPTQGRIPHLPPSPVRSAGPLARTVADTALMLTTLAGADPRDYGCIPADGTRYETLLDRDLSGLRIGIVMEGQNRHMPEPAVTSAVEAAAKVLENAGATIVPLPWVVGDDFMETTSIIFLMRGFTEFQKLPEHMRAMIPDHFTAWFERIPSYSAIDVGNSLDRLEVIKARVLAQLAEVDFMISPVLSYSGFPAEMLQVPTEQGGIGYTPVWNQTGNPAASICCGFDTEKNLPIGLQIIGQRFDDLGVLQLAAAYERMRGFEMHWPD